MSGFSLQIQTCWKMSYANEIVEKMSYTNQIVEKNSYTNQIIEKNSYTNQIVEEKILYKSNFGVSNR